MIGDGLPPEEQDGISHLIINNGNGRTAALETDAVAVKRTAFFNGADTVPTDHGVIGAVEVDSRVPCRSDQIARDGDTSNPEGSVAVVGGAESAGVGAAIDHYTTAVIQGGEGGDMDVVTGDGDAGVLVLNFGEGREGLSTG